MIQDIKKFSSELNLIVIQELIGYTTDSIIEKPPQIFRCFFEPNSKWKIYQIKRIKQTKIEKEKRNGQLLERKMSMRKSSIIMNVESCFPCSLLDQNEKIRFKYCLDTSNSKVLKVYQYSIELFPKLIASCEYILTIIEKYSLKKQNADLKNLVIDFIEDSQNNIIFLQIKYLEMNKPRMNKSHFRSEFRKSIGMPRKKNNCQFIFCNPIYSDEVQAFVGCLMLRKIIKSNFVSWGINIDKAKDINDYIEEFIRLGGNLFTQSEISIFKPLFNFTIHKEKSSNSRAIIINKSDFELKYTCDVCHKILGLYINKKDKIEENNGFTYKVLRNLKAKQKNELTSEDFTLLIDELSYNMPKFLKKSSNSLLINSISQMDLKCFKNQQKYYFGYKIISDSLDPESMFLSTQKQPSTFVIKNYIAKNKLNILNINHPKNSKLK